MGLIRAGLESAKGLFADQWREYFYCDTMEQGVLVTRALKKSSRRSSNTKGHDNIISNGSIIAINEGQCMIIVEQGKVAEICDEAGEFIYDTSTEPSVFYGSLSESVKKSFETLGRRFSFGGDTAKDQRVYFVNTKEIMGNKYGTANPIPYRVVDANIGLDLEISIRCHGEYSFAIVDPILFYTNVCGNVTDEFCKESMEGQMRSELLTAMQTAFVKIAEQGIRYYQLAGHTTEIAEALNQELSAKWADIRGIRIVSFGISGVKAPEEDEEMIRQLQKTAVMRNPGMAAAALTEAQAEAMKAAAANTATGPMFAFANMNAAAQAGGVNAGNLFQMDQANQQAMQQQAAQQAMWQAQQAQQAQPQMQAQQAQQVYPQMQAGAAQSAADTWTCSCGAAGNTGRFCSECGSKKPVQKGWICSCGAVNKGKFCSECGSKKPAGASLYKCDKCGWEPKDPANPPKFCPECGDPFDDRDVK